MKLRKNIRRTQLFVSISELELLIKLVHDHRALHFSIMTCGGEPRGKTPCFGFVDDLRTYLISKESQEAKP